MISITKYEELVKSILDRVENGFYNRENYVYIHNEIVNKFAEERIDKILENSIEPNDIDISVMFDKFVKRLNNPILDTEFINNELSYSLRHILQTWDYVFFEKSYPINIDAMIENCKNMFNIDIDINSLIDFYQSRELIILNNDVLEKYRKLFKIYLTIDDSKSLLSNLNKKKRALIPIYMISDLDRGVDIEISMRDIIIREEVRNLRNICENTITGDRYKYGNFIERLFISLNITKESKFKYYLKQFHENNDLWSLSLVSLLFKKYEKMNEKKYLDKKAYIDFEQMKELFIEYYTIIKEIIIQTWKISQWAIFHAINDSYKDWINMYIEHWDNHWNSEILSYIKSKLNEAKEFNLDKIRDVVALPSNTDNGGNDKQIKEFELLKNLKWEEITFEIDHPRGNIEITARDRSTEKHKLEDFGLLADKKNKTGMTVFWDLLRDFEACHGTLPGIDMITPTKNLKDRISRFRQHLRELFPYIEDEYPITRFNRGLKYTLKINLEIQW